MIHWSTYHWEIVSPLITLIKIKCYSCIIPLATLDKLKSVGLAVGRPRFDFLGKSDKKTWYSQLPWLTFSIKRNSVESKSTSLLVMSLSKTLNGILLFWVIRLVVTVAGWQLDSKTEKDSQTKDSKDHFAFSWPR